MADRNISIFYFVTVTHASAFIIGNWIFYWLHFMTYGQLGIVDATAFAFGVFMEIPTGAISDMVGKRLTLIGAGLFAGVGFLVMGVGSSLFVLWIGFLIAQIGWAFHSGAAEALVYDSLKQEGREAEFEHVISRSHAVALITLVFAALIGAVMYEVHWRLPHVAWGAMFLLGSVAAHFVIEPQIDSVHFSWANYKRQLAAGFHQLKLPELRPFVPMLFATLGVYFLFGSGLVQPAIATSFGFFEREQAVAGALLNIMAAITVQNLAWFRRRFSDWQGLVIITILIGAGMLLAALPLGYLGFFALLILHLAGRLSFPWFSIIVNDVIPSADRATTLSTVSLITKIPYIFTAMLAGVMIERGYLWLFNAAIGSIALVVLVGSLLWYGSVPVPDKRITKDYSV